QVITNRDDRAIPDQYVGLIGTIRRYDGAVPDNFGHASVPLFFRAASAEQLQNPNLKDSDHSTISAISTTAWNSTSAPAAAHSFEISSASLCDRPSTHGHMTIAVGATRLIQQASCPAPETMFRWE